MYTKAVGYRTRGGFAVYIKHERIFFGAVKVRRFNHPAVEGYIIGCRYFEILNPVTRVLAHGFGNAFAFIQWLVIGKGYPFPGWKSFIIGESMYCITAAGCYFVAMGSAQTSG